jgi:hypothetical protein
MSPTNVYFQSGNTSGTTNEQRLLEDLIIESISIYGHDVYYLPRTSVNQNNILGEDALSRFNTAIPLEMYLTNIQGWEGNGELFSKFGIQVTDQANFVVSKRRWEDVVGSSPKELLQLPSRPAEGDLIYFPKTNSMFEIKFVQHLDPFYQLGKFYIYNMSCELYQYSSEIFATGIPEIDVTVNVVSQDVFEYEILNQTGTRLVSTKNGSLIKQSFNTNDLVPFSDSELFETQGKDILDFTEINPFGEY